MNELLVENEIGNRIFLLRGKEVMLDRDLAELYGVETKRVNEAVRNNQDKFLEDFYFELTDKEFEILRSKNPTAKFAKTRVNPKVFTEQGVYMLATVLKSKTASEVTVSIIRTFAKLRAFSKHYNALAKKIMELERKNDKQFKEIFKKLDNLVHDAQETDEKIMGFIKPENNV
ncbi:ORF6N domain-containing protein [Sulfurovum riftiae]|uniref:DNA-binding protein n=1 Tax=Sulfurovum riftiae TaxID=1630136 RepID=A0A151CHM8_9BACT|nr:ORF6N domain-containing protein [Sulfurovum riftiae]KYJ87021.1 DNA-binding protein [Sulfurovum riftiae]